MIQGAHERALFIITAPVKTNTVKSNPLHALIAAAIICIISGCSSSKQSLTYFEELKSLPDGEMQVDIPQLRIVPDDALLITVNSEVPDASAPYNVPLFNPQARATNTYNTTVSQPSYIVDSKGDIEMPVIGTVHAAGLTTAELAAHIRSRVAEDLTDPYVRVELLSFTVHVLGEVTKPQSIKVEKERFSILEALAAAGDLTPYGDRSTVMLIRQDDGVNRYYHLNLNDARLLSSPYFYLRQNDVIVIEPNNIRKANARYNQDNAYKLSVISTIVSASSVVASLAIALATK